MSDYKKYYYLKLKDHFYDRPEIKAIEGLQNGYEYICIMQKMYLRSLERDGKLMLTDTVPYNIQTLSNVLGHKEETINAAIKIFIKFDLCRILDDQSIYMTEIQNFIGESSTEADRIRAYRKQIPTVTNVRQLYDERTPKIEIETKKKKERKKERDNISATPVKKRSDDEHDCFNKMYDAFKTEYGTFEPGMESREIKALWQIVDKAKCRDPENFKKLAWRMVSQFFNIIKNPKKEYDFISRQPALPSALNSSGIWPRVLNTLHEMESRKPTEEDKRILNMARSAMGGKT